MKAPTLVILAAGMGSRFGGMKQMTPVDPQGNFIMDYSIYDAHRAGFGKVVCVIKEEMREDFEALVGGRVRAHVELAYSYQSLDRMLPEGFTVPEGRVKPWGTTHAVMCAVDELDGPFAIINADDFYGSEAFKALADFLKQEHTATQHAMVGYNLENTVTDHGSVSRGVCQVDGNGFLSGVVERTTIEKRPNGAAYTEDGGKTWIDLPAGTVVSMNMWGFQRPALDLMIDMFKDFLANNLPANPMKAEYFLPLVSDRMINTGSGTIEVLNTDAKWYGMTYKEDLQGVMDAIADMKKAGAYPESLWG